MTTEITCPICRGGVLSRGGGELEQSGNSYLPTVVWSCELCEYKHYESATGAHWRPRSDASPAPETPAHRRAA